jgi:hypothetical protein
MEKRALVLAVVVAVPLLDAGAPAATRRTPCPADRYVVQDGPLLPGAPASQVDVVAIEVTPPGVTLSIGCGATQLKGPVKVRATRKGTKLAAQWLDCGGLSGGLRLKGILTDRCARLSATLRARGLKTKRTAARSACGDGFHDAGGEACDANDACGSGTPCTGDCTCATTTTTTPTTTTTTLAPGACDPVAAPGAQGCPAGEKCTWIHLQDTPTALGQIGCVPSGAGGLDAACSYGPPGETTGFDDCAAGLVCAGSTCKDVCGFDGSGASACATGFECTRYSDLFGNGDDEPIAGACIPSCNPLTQLRGTGEPCGAGQGCYLLTGITGTAGVCAGAGTLGHGAPIVGPAYANSCLPGHQPRRVSSASTAMECGALCQPTDVYQGFDEASEGGVAPYTCEAAGAAAPSDPTNGESCHYWWMRESVDFVTPFSNTVGWCFKHAAFQYDSDGDTVPDAPYPRCVDLTTGDLVPPLNGASDALYFGCVAFVPGAPTRSAVR